MWGFARAAELAKQGAKLVLNARRRDRLEELATECGDRGKVGLIYNGIDVPPPDTDAVLTANYALLKKGALVIALSGLIPTSFSDDLFAALAEMLDQGDVDPVLHTLRSRYVLLQQE